MSNEPLPQSEIILYQTEDGRTRVQCRFENETLWLTQALIAELFQVTVPTVNEHLKRVFAERELTAAATIRNFRIVRLEGRREVARDIEHYNLDAILAVGFRVRGHRGTQFRQWAIGRLNEYLVKGFTKPDTSGKVSHITRNDDSPRHNTTVWIYSDTRDLGLKWRKSADTKAVPVGVFRFDLKGLLKSGHCTPAGKKIRFNIYHDDDRWLRVRDKRADGGGEKIVKLDW